MIYIPKNKNLKPLTQTEVNNITKRIKEIQTQKLPWPIWNPKNITWYQDNGMNMDNCILGLIQYLNKNKILLSPITTQGLKYGNIISTATIIHELTHRHQMSWAHGLLWPLINLPLIRHWLTTEKWATQNEQATIKQLTNKRKNT